MIQEYNNGLSTLIVDNNPVILDFYAEWCGPCKMLSKNLEKFSKNYPNILICKINVEEHPELTEQYQVQNLPTIICVNIEGEVWRNIGLMTVQALEEKFRDA